MATVKVMRVLPVESLEGWVVEERGEDASEVIRSVASIVLYNRTRERESPTPGRLWIKQLVATHGKAVAHLTEDPVVGLIEAFRRKHWVVWLRIGDGLKE